MGDDEGAFGEGVPGEGAFAHDVVGESGGGDGGGIGLEACESGEESDNGCRGAAFFPEGGDAEAVVSFSEAFAVFVAGGGV